jgi:glycerol-3-phosphate O-acyltransferase
LLEYAGARGLPTVEGVELGRSRIVRKAVSTLVREGVLTEFTQGTEPVYAIASERHLEAAFYRNNVIHHFVTRAITELALVHAAEHDCDDRAAEYWEEALRLRDLLKFEFFFPRKRVFADDLRAEVDILDPGWEQRPAEREQIRAVLEQAPVYLAHRVLGPFVQAYGVVADRLAAREPHVVVDEPAFLAEALGVGRQYLLQRRLESPESISGELFRGALSLAANRGLVEPGDEDLRDRRRAFAAEVRDVGRRIRVIRALALGNMRAPETPWVT